MNSRPEEIGEIIRDQIKNYRSKVEMTETGRVILVGDGIARVYGLRSCMANELLRVRRRLLRYGAEPRERTPYPSRVLSDDDSIREGTVGQAHRARRSSRSPSATRSSGRVVNASRASRSTARAPPRSAARPARSKPPRSRHHRAPERLRAASDRHQGNRQQ